MGEPIPVKNEVGRLVDLWHDPCLPSAPIMVETAIEAAIHMAWDSAYPDMKEIVHKATGKSVVCHVEGIVHEVLGEDPYLHNCLRQAFFRALGVADMATYIIWAESEINRTIAAWTSQVHRYQTCDNPYGKNAGYGQAIYGASSDQGRWSIMGDWVIRMPSIWGPVWPCTAVAPGNKGIVCSWAATGTDFMGRPVAYATRLVNRTTGEILAAGQQSLDGCCPDGKSMGWCPGARVREGDVIALEATSPGRLPLGEVFPRGGRCWVAWTD